MPENRKLAWARQVADSLSLPGFRPVRRPPPATRPAVGGMPEHPAGVAQGAAVQARGAGPRPQPPGDAPPGESWEDRFGRTIAWVTPDRQLVHAPDLITMVQAAEAEAGGEKTAKARAAVAAAVQNRGNYYGADYGPIIRTPHQFSYLDNPGLKERVSRLKPGDPRFDVILGEILPVVLGAEPDPTKGAIYYANPDTAVHQRFMDTGFEEIEHHNYYTDQSPFPRPPKEPGSRSYERRLKPRVAPVPKALLPPTPPPTYIPYAWSGPKWIDEALNITRPNWDLRPRR